LLVSGGLGGMGGAQPLAATMAGFTFLGVDVDPERIKKRLHTKYIDKIATSFNEAKHLILQALEKHKPLSVGLVGNIGDVLEEMLHEGLIQCHTDQTSTSSVERLRSGRPVA
jgi:urocanate hydratase